MESPIKFIMSHKFLCAVGYGLQVNILHSKFICTLTYSRNDTFINCLLFNNKDVQIYGNCQSILRARTFYFEHPNTIQNTEKRRHKKKIHRLRYQTIAGHLCSRWSRINAMTRFISNWGCRLSSWSSETPHSGRVNWQNTRKRRQKRKIRRLLHIKIPRKLKLFCKSEWSKLIHKKRSYVNQSRGLPRTEWTEGGDTGCGFENNAQAVKFVPGQIDRCMCWP